MQSSEMSISSVLAFPVGRGKRLDHTGEGRKAGREARIGDPGEAQGPATQDSTQDRVPRGGTQDQAPRRGTRTCCPEQYPGLGPQERHPRSGPQEDDQKEREEKKEGDGSKGLRGREGQRGTPGTSTRCHSSKRTEAGGEKGELWPGGSGELPAPSAALRLGRRMNGAPLLLAALEVTERRGRQGGSD